MNMHQPTIEACPLSEKESEVLRWLSLGKTLGETAEIVGIHHMTVARRIRTAREKTGDYVLHGLVARAVRNGWVS